MTHTCLLLLSTSVLCSEEDGKPPMAANPIPIIQNSTVAKPDSSPAPARSEKSKTLEFKWGKMRGKGGKKKDTQFYQSFTLNGVDYQLYDTVYVQNGSSERSVGKIIKIWETPTSEKLRKVKVQWFLRPCQISKFLIGVKIYYNELFFACGDGPELAAVIALESIAGKCNVVCISKDARNPQPSEETVRSARFLFYRYFDVGQHKIVEEVDEKIVGIEVKNLFNIA